MNLYVPLQLVEQKDVENVDKTIDEDRKSIIQVSDYEFVLFLKMIFSLSGSYCSNNESPSNTQTDSPHSRSH
jgi:hypothetical protein